MFLLNLKSTATEDLLAHAFILFLGIIFAVPIVLDLKFYLSSQIGVASVVGEYTDQPGKAYITLPIINLLNSEEHQVKGFKMQASGASDDYKRYLTNTQQLAVRFNLNDAGHIDQVRIDHFNTLWLTGIYAFLFSLLMLLLACLDKNAHYWLRYFVLKKIGCVQIAHIDQIEQYPHGKEIEIATVLHVKMPFSNQIYVSRPFKAQPEHSFQEGKMIEVWVSQKYPHFYLVQLHHKV